MARPANARCDQIVDEAQTLPPGEQLHFIRAMPAPTTRSVRERGRASLSRQAWFDDDDRLDPSHDRARLDPTGTRIGPYRIRAQPRPGRHGRGVPRRARRRAVPATSRDQAGAAGPVVAARRRRACARSGRSSPRSIIRTSPASTTAARPATARRTSSWSTSTASRIDLYCDRRRLTIEQRLELFVTVC